MFSVILKNVLFVAVARLLLTDICLSASGVSMAETKGAEFVRRTPGTAEAVNILMGELQARSRSDAIRDAICLAAMWFRDGTPEQKTAVRDQIGVARARFGVR